MRSHRRREPLQHAVVVGTSADLLSLQMALAVLPASTYGQVLVETAEGEDLGTLQTPARMTVLRVPADRCPGTAVARAVSGWLEEWMPQESDAAREVTIWVGATARTEVDAHCAELGDLLQLL